MFNYPESKEMSALLRTHYRAVLPGLDKVFCDSILGSNLEKIYLQKLINNLTKFLNGLSIPGFFFSTRSTSIHQKPLVRTNMGLCELGDLLVVIKYHSKPYCVETKSIIYQIKLTQNSKSRDCKIDQRQLTLLCDWPSFSFGGLTYNITPKTIEFGSFMLEPRNPDINLINNISCCGKCPHAILVRQLGPKTVNIESIPYTRRSASNFFRHLLFEIGEHHSNQAVEDMINALYRFIGLQPDPPHEFDDYSKEMEDDGFAVLEINIKSELKSSNVEGE